MPNKKDPNGAVFKMHEFLDALSITFRGYFILKDYADYLGAKIYNCSKKSYIDAFERCNLDKLREK